jgi:hypothetical protein
MGWGTSFGSDLLHALTLCLSYGYVTPRVTPFAQTHPYTALPELDANANAIAFEMIVLQNEGHERDESIVEVAET